MSPFPDLDAGQNMKTKIMKIQTESIRGQSMIEFAVGIVVLLILLAGVVDLTRAIFTYISYRDAAEEAAVYGSLFPTYCNQIQDRALSILGYPATIVANITITTSANVDYDCMSAPPEAACLGNTITVEVKDPHFEIGMPFLATFLGNDYFPLSAIVHNSIIRTPCQ
jgi:hypothetical protein